MRAFTLRKKENIRSQPKYCGLLRDVLQVPLAGPEPGGEPGARVLDGVRRVARPQIADFAD